MKNYLYFLLCLLLFSCKKKEENPFIGNWSNVDSINDNEDNFGLNILNDSILEYQFGFYEYVPTKMKILGFLRDTLDRDIEALRFLGTKTKFKVKDSKLSFWDLTDSIWNTYQIKIINQNTLNLIDKNKKEYRLVKNKNTYKNITQYDAIVVDRALGFGCCGINSTYINRDGKMYFKGLGNNTNEEDLTTKLDRAVTNQIFKNFDKINIFGMKDSYGRSVTDAQNNTITFIKNGKIVKTIQDYARKAPIDFYAAYNELSYLFQKVAHYDTITFIFDNRVHFPSLENKTFKHTLYNSELFLLDLELRKGKVTTTSFEPKYTLNFSYYNRGFLFHKIVTDGRYYTFYYNDNTTKTIDIGYNFIDTNPILTKPRRN
ncbi:DUF6438 domain-containing protein [Flavobacterium sp. J27]|uniref:DUF6438 domain-containing protein n=1 Tax=Flavobacterium sp. J27 TaxID=2060419 RepID=UPI00102FA6FA|nr:DUF6438 domain-containing protein [Flavobacterium sp. J27]